MNSEEKNNHETNQGRSARKTSSIGFAFVLILLGAFFLARQIGGITLHNWWALFILIPVIGAFGSALNLWQRSGRFTFTVWSTFFGGLFPLLVAAMFLFDLDWGKYWPWFVILAGVGMIINGLPVSREGDKALPPALVCHRSWALGVGLSATLVGLTFLGRHLGWFDNPTFLNVKNWWGIFILIPSVGGLLTMLCLLIGRHSMILALINLAASGLIAFAGIVAMYDLDWNLVNLAAPILLILAGIGLIVGFGKSKKDDESH